MVQYSNVNIVMDARDHFKKEASLKIPIVRKNFRITHFFSKSGIMTMIAIVAMFITSVTNAQTKSNTQQAEQSIVFLESNSINTLEDAIKPLLGKKIYISVWATYCGPCKVEFAHNEALKKILTENGIQQLYISVERDDTNHQQWKDMVTSYNLTGTHIRANAELSKDLGIIFAVLQGRLAIPWYILVDEQGNIIKKNAKSPSKLVAGAKL